MPKKSRKKYRRRRKKRKDSTWLSMVHWKSYLIISSIIAIVTTGTIGFMRLENLRALDALYLTIATITTVGYGDITPVTHDGKIFAIVIMISGIGVALFGLTTVVEFIISGKLMEAMKARDFAGLVRRYKKHVIICGYGRVGRAAAEYLLDNDVPIVILDQDEEQLKRIDVSVPRFGCEATKEDMLLKAGVDKAVAVLSCMGSDSDNLMSIVTLKYVKPSVIAITRASGEEEAHKMQRVGADLVVEPEAEGGTKMVKEIEKGFDLSDKDAGKIIVCGYGRVGRAAVKALNEVGADVNVIEKSDECCQNISPSVHYIHGDSTKEDILRRAGIAQALAVIAATGDDADNLMIVVSAKDIKPSVICITRSGEEETKDKMLKVGADMVIQPETEGGKTMASAALKAHKLAMEGD
jgi:voltage-gated potassium channel